MKKVELRKGGGWEPKLTETLAKSISFLLVLCSHAAL